MINEKDEQPAYRIRSRHPATRGVRPNSTLPELVMIMITMTIELMMMMIMIVIILGLYDSTVSDYEDYDDYVRQ